jgi:hypothetical protein
MKITIDSFNKTVDSYFHIPTKQEGWKGKDIARVVSWVFGGAVIGGTARLLGHGAAVLSDLYGSVTKGPLLGCPISKLPDEVLVKILEGVDSSTLGNALRTSKAFNRAAMKVIDEALSKPFDANQWKKFMGADIGIEPPLPANIGDILSEACPFSTDGKTVAETHLLMLIPETINGKPLNINTLEKLFKKNFPTVGDDDTGYKFIWYEIQADAVDHGKSSWVLMTRDVIEGSRGKTFAEQQALLAEKGHNLYEVPPILDATACILLEYARSLGQTRLYGDRPLTFTRCQENIYDFQLVVGNFVPDGLSLSFHVYDIDSLGVAAMRKLT